MKVGMPVMLLDRQDHFGNKSQHTGNAKAVVCEALSERYCNDEDLDRSKTIDNIYLGKYTSGEDLEQYWENMADEYRIQTQDGKSRRIPKNAGIGFAGIVKPCTDDFGDWSLERKIQYFKDSYAVLQEMYGQKDSVIDCAVIHVDEGEVHMHYFGHDPEYRINQKYKSLPWYKRLNTEYPKRMQALGYDVQVLTGYQEDTKDMTAEQLQEYKDKKRQARKHGRSAKQYKADKQLERTNQEIMATQDTLQATREAVQREIEKLQAIQQQVVQARTEAITAKQEAEQERKKCKKMRNIYDLGVQTYKRQQERALQAEEITPDNNQMSSGAYGTSMSDL